MRAAATNPTPTPVKPLNTRQLAKAATRAKVLSSAKTAFETCGYERADMRTIAAWSCVSTGAIFGHFSGKAELYREVYGHDPISPEVGRELLVAARPLAKIWADACRREKTDSMRRLDAAGETQTHHFLRICAAIALATTPSEGSGSSVASRGGSPQAAKSDNHNASEGGR